MFSGYKRTDIYHKLEQERLDVLVIGGNDEKCLRQKRHWPKNPF